ncbi:MAG: 23S rRNA (guanosine(2251)-2'-O)-methyltransferase RlmB [Burkholderiaceae bacterium]
MTKDRILFGFHAVTARVRHDAKTVGEVYVEAGRRDKRMQDFLRGAQGAGLRVLAVDRARLDGLVGHGRHQGVAARASVVPLSHSIDEILDELSEPALLLVLDGITDPHNLGACLRVADGAGAHAVIAPKDRACGLNATAAKAASGAAESVPYITVTNLARTLRELQEREIRVVGTEGASGSPLYESELKGPLALVIGAEGEGMRRLTRETCDVLVSIPMTGVVESLNASVAAAICLYEARRQRQLTIGVGSA